MRDVVPDIVTEVSLRRAQAGLKAARDHNVRNSIQKALSRVQSIAEGDWEPRVDGSLRRFVLRSLIHTLFQVRIEPLEAFPKGSNIIVANHLSHIDPFLLLSEIPTQPYYYVLGDARTLYNRCWKRQILDWAGGVIPIERHWKEETAIINAAKLGRQDLVNLALAIERDVPTGDSIRTLRQISKAVLAMLSRGDGVLLFPEGRLGAREGVLSTPLKRGIAIYALRTGVPVIPVALIGTQNLYLRKLLIVRFGQPLQFSRMRRPKSQDIQAVLNDLQVAINTLLPKQYQDPPGLKLFQYFLNHMFW